MKHSINETVPVFINRAPWNELLIRGQRKLKTISFPWKYRGPILLYTSKKEDYIGDLDYRLPQEVELNKGHIVGKAEVVDVVPTRDPSLDSFYQDDPNLWETDGQDYLVVVKNVKRFKKPIPSSPKGAIRIFRAPANLLEKPTR